MALEYFCCFNSYRKKTRNLSDSELGRLFRALMTALPSTRKACDLRQNGLKHRMKVQTEVGKLALAVHGNPDGQHHSTNIAHTVAKGW